jgi:hypothetical protein
MTSSSRTDLIVTALIHGLDWLPEAVTPTARRALEKAAGELAGLEGLELQVLRQARTLWVAAGESGPLYAGSICKVYPELERQHRTSTVRARRLEAERLERHRLYAMSTLELSEHDAQEATG